MIYRTIQNKVFVLDDLSEAHRELYRDMCEYFLQDTGWHLFDNAWHNDNRLRTPEKVSAESPIWKILADMSARIAIRNNLACFEKWREKLERIIHYRFGTARAFCKKTDTNEGFLSNILRGKKAFSLDNLEKRLRKAGIQIIFMSVDVWKTGEEE